MHTAWQATKFIMENVQEPPRGRGDQGKRFVFTINNPGPEEEKYWSQPDTSLFVRIIVGRETGASGTPHYQGYVETSRRMRVNELRRAAESGLARAAIFVARGSRLQNYRYCSKDGDILFQIGDFGKPKQDSALSQLRASIDDGLSELEIARDNFSLWCLHRRAFREYRSLSYEQVDREVRVIVHVGASGTGKTRAVYALARDSGREIWSWGGGPWFDGYLGQELALFDDFDGSDFPYRLLLRVLDRYPIRVPVKGGFVQWTPLEIHVTTNIEPERWYPDDSRPLLRRIHQRIDY